MAGYRNIEREIMANRDKMTPEQIKMYETKKEAARKTALFVNKELKKTNPDAQDMVVVVGDHPEMMQRYRISTGNPALNKILDGGIVLGIPIEISGLPG